MKTYKFLSALALLALGMATVSCENGDIDFPDSEDGVNVYFATQNVDRTIVLGEDEADVTLDNQHKCKIGATMGGAYGGRNIKVEVAVDNSLCDNLYFADGTTPVTPMPANYYKLSTTTLNYGGQMTGWVEVQLTDDFFNDPKALTTNYVIPLVMKSQTGADSILSGKVIVDGETPQLTNSGRWDVQPKNYVLYGVKYICKYDANYIRRGVDEVSFGGSTTRTVRHKERLDLDEVKADITTRSLNAITYPVTVTVNGEKRTANLIVTFDAQDNATVTSATSGVTASGSGSYKAKAEKKAWGDKDRDGLYLDYKVQFADGATVATKDTLIWQSRGVKPQSEFQTTYKQ